MARPKTPNGERWLRYALRTPNCLPLDPGAYASTVYDREVIPWPDWCCKAPDGGVHIDARLAAIDVHLLWAPNGPDEVSWTCNFQLLLASREWLAQIEDLIDGRQVALGRVFVDGKALTDWATIMRSKGSVVQPMSMAAAATAAKGWLQIWTEKYVLRSLRSFSADTL